MAKVLISGYYGYKNFGDELILSVLVNHLKSLNSDITVLSGDVEYTEQNNGVRAVKRFDIAKVINEIKNCDVLISGGGSLLQDVTSIKSLIYYAFILSLGILFNKKVIIFAQGIGPLNSKLSKTIVKNILKCCSYVSVRDEKSQNLLSDWKIKADLVCDPVYSLKLSKFENQADKNKVGIQLRDFPSMNYNLLQKLACLICEKFPDKKIEILSLQKSQDYEVCVKFKNILLNINPSIQAEIVEENIIKTISGLEYFIGMRFHSLLIALMSGVRACAINYDIKVETLSKEAQIPLISMSAKENFEEIYNLLQNLNAEKLLQYTNSKRFDWSEFDKLL